MSWGDNRDPRATTLRAELESAGLWALLAEDPVTDVMVNQGGHVFAAAIGRGSYDTGRHVPADQVESLLATIAGLQGLVVTGDQPILEGTLPFGGVRVEGVLPPIALAPILALRKPASRHYSLADLEGLGTFRLPVGRKEDAAPTEPPKDLRGLLCYFIRDRWTCLIAGGVGSGKTTLLSAIVAEIFEQNPNERLLVCEEAAREVRSDGRNSINLLTSEQAGVDMTRLLRVALRLNPDRLIVGEARGAEAMVFLKACNTGHPGGLLTIHANGALDAVDRLDDLAQEAGVASQRARIASTIDAVIFVRRFPEGRRVAEVLALMGLDLNGKLRHHRLFPTVR